MGSCLHQIYIPTILFIACNGQTYSSNHNLIAQTLQRSFDESLHGVMDDILRQHIIAEEQREQLQKLILWYSEDTKYINIAGMDIDSLNGISFPDHILSILIRDNRLSSFGNCHFPKELQSLMASSNQINTINRGELPFSLISLELQNNHISTETFSHFFLPPNLKTLDISMNNITNIPFGSLPLHLHQLQIGWNPLEDIRGLNELSNLRVLKIQNAGLRLEMLQQIQFPNTMHMIDLSGNPLRSFDGVTFPNRLNSLWLNDMELTNNKLESLRAVLPEELLLLSLENNLITDLGAFSKGLKLSQLNVNGNTELDLMTICPNAEISTLIVGMPQLEAVIKRNEQITIHALKYAVVNVDDSMEQLSVRELFEMGDGLKRHFRSEIRDLQVRVATNRDSGKFDRIAV